MDNPLNIFQAGENLRIEDKNKGSNTVEIAGGNPINIHPSKPDLHTENNDRGSIHSLGNEGRKSSFGNNPENLIDNTTIGQSDNKTKKFENLRAKAVEKIKF